VRARLDRAFGESEVLSEERAARLLAERARSLARRLQATAAARAATLELLCFSLARERYAIEARYVFQVLRLTELTRLPGAPEHVLGITSLRGELLPVFDIRMLLGVAPESLCDMSRLIVLGTRTAEFGILADVVHELSAIDRSALLAPPDSIAGAGRTYLRGVTADALIVLDGGVLLEDQALYIGDAGEVPGENR
jgi:purine-binding chemotaxis protein CheW